MEVIKAETRFRAFCLGIALVFFVAGVASADTWYEAYHRAKEALDDDRWSEAVLHLNAAIEQNPNSNSSARTYGMRFESYFPYLKLGVAYHHLGQLDAAEAALETEERQAAIESASEAFAELQDYKTRIERTRRELESQRQARARQVLAENLNAARDLEQQGSFDAALEAVSRALAIEPDNAQALELRARILEAVAGWQREREREERFAELVDQGRRELASGDFQTAAATLSRALDLRSDSEVQALLEEARTGIRDALGESQDAEARRQVIVESLARTRVLEADGDLLGALEELQAVLVLEPQHPEASRMRTRLLTARQAFEDQQSQAETLSQLLTHATQLLAEGRPETALVQANRALALDPSNAGALKIAADAYTELNRLLLATDMAPPAVMVDGLGEGGKLVTRSSEVLLSGSVYASTAVDVEVVDAESIIAKADVEPRQFQGVWITGFTARYRATVGSAEMEVVAIDRTGQTAQQEITVEYVVPFLRSRSFVVLILIAAVGILLGWMMWRAAHRRRLLEKRFNPYVAGAPILDEERFFGRRQLLDYVLRRISNNSILLYGERRIGKTSFQHQLKDRLENLQDPDHVFYPVFIDLQGTPEERFFATMAAEVFEGLEPVLDCVQTGRSFEEDSYGYRDFVKDIQKVLKQLKARSEKKTKLVLLIDEVDELNDYDPRVNQKLRSLFMRTFADNLVSVVSGVAIKKHWEREGSPWYNFFQEIEVTPLDPDEARSLIELPVKGIFSFDDGVTEEILRRTDRKPYRIQRLCSALVDRLHEDGRRRVTLKDVEDAGPAAETQ